MNHDSENWRSRNCHVSDKTKVSKRVPLLTIHELAEEFGVTAVSLTYWMRADPAGPRPAIQTTRHSASGCKTYYKPHEVRAWFAVNGSKVATKAAIESPKP